MRYVYFLLILMILQNCSFDKNSGIWKSESNTLDDKNIQFKDFKTLLSSEESFNEIVPFNNSFKFNLPKEIKNKEWNDIFFNYNNNFKNFQYTNLNRLILTSKKISKNINNKYLLSENQNIITSDKKGNLIIFSIDTNKIVAKFNFYKKNFKKIEKNLNLIVEKNIIYVSDNIGYLYAYNYEKKQLIWAKNYKVPFRSNLKIIKDKLVASNQNNNLFFFNKNNGLISKTIPTEENLIKNKFVSNISADKKNVMFLNTYGSLYSINSESMKVNWFLNLNRTLDLNPSNLFRGSPIINNEKKIILASNNHTYIIESKTGRIIHKKNFSSQVKPIILNNYLFLITKNDLLVSLDVISGNIIYSYDINQKISDYLNIKKKQVTIKDIFIAGGKILIFLDNSYLLIFNINGDLNDVKKLSSKLKSSPIIVDGSIIYLNKKNKLSVLN